MGEEIKARLALKDEHHATPSAQRSHRSPHATVTHTKHDHARKTTPDPETICVDSVQTRYGWVKRIVCGGRHGVLGCFAGCLSLFAYVLVMCLFVSFVFIAFILFPMRFGCFHGAGSVHTEHLDRAVQQQSISSGMCAAVQGCVVQVHPLRGGVRCTCAARVQCHLHRSPVAVCCRQASQSRGILCKSMSTCSCACLIVACAAAISPVSGQLRELSGVCERWVADRVTECRGARMVGDVGDVARCR